MRVQQQHIPPKIGQLLLPHILTPTKTSVEPKLKKKIEGNTRELNLLGGNRSTKGKIGDLTQTLAKFVVVVLRVEGEEFSEKW